MKRMLLAVLFLTSVQAQAQGYFVSGNQLVELMREWERANQKSPDTDPVKAGSYYGYIKGVYDGLDLNKIICSPSGITVGQASAVVAKFLAANPERWEEPAFVLVTDALKSAFPCRAR